MNMLKLTIDVNEGVRLEKGSKSLDVVSIGHATMERGDGYPLHITCYEIRLEGKPPEVVSVDLGQCMKLREKAIDHLGEPVEIYYEKMRSDYELTRDILAIEASLDTIVVKRFNYYNAREPACIMADPNPKERRSQ